MARSKSKSKKELDDTPRRFKRMMEMKAQMGKPRQPVKPSPKPSKKTMVPEPVPKLEIKKGESMRDFSRRVDEAIPLPKARGGDSRKTIKNAKKHKAKAENLRAEYKQRLDAKRRREEDADLDNIDVEDDGEDVWASINARANKPRFNEVADRPPELPTLKKFSSVPKSAGSMARRQVLEEERQKVIDYYRKMRNSEPSVPAEE